ncbi:DUF5412 family protein [Lysinibacillus sp. NPDC056959]|uniref:DUF5412 family protein n=1 Tax=Lysinibacillus sp. NPDC056959 TaxID=3345981 RepID=UPI0036415B09
MLLIWILFFTSIIGYGIYWLFFDWSRCKQDLIAYTVKAYVSDAGATTFNTVLGELILTSFSRSHLHLS